MKSTTKLFFISVFLIFTGSYSSLACHQGGFELRYTHLNGANYRVQCTFFRDCFGITLAALTLNVSSFSCGITQTYAMTQVPNSAREVTFPCTGHVSSCNGGNEIGIESVVYQVDIILNSCPDWIMSVSDCCRNGAITTLQLSALDLVVEARLNNSSDHNSSPVFTTDPFFTSSINEDFIFNNGAIDPDGDSLVYNLITPRSSLNSYYSYNTGFTSQQPFQSVPDVSLNHSTGDFYMHPTTSQVGVVVYEIQEFRNGQFIGSVTRDVINFILPNYTNKTPHLTGVNGTAVYQAAAQPGQELCFNILSDDADVTDALTLDWNHSINGASFTVNNALHPEGMFCWTPSWSDVRTQPYFFTASVKDNGCPLNVSSVYSYAVYVTSDSIIDYNRDIDGSATVFSISPNPTTGAFSVSSREELTEISIYSPIGECIQKNNFQGSLDLNNSPAGIYFVKVTTKSGDTFQQRIIKK